MVNIVILLGRLGQTADIKPINATNVARFSLATDRSYKKADEWVNETDWHSIEAWGLSEKILDKLVKGAMVHVEGSLRTEKWTDSEGHSRNTTKVRAAVIKVLNPSSQVVAQEQVVESEDLKPPAPKPPKAKK